jgi:RNA polymerase sigma-B factor
VARDRAIAEHMPLVESIARRYARSGEPLDDLVQTGSVGLIKAVDRFDPARGRSLAAFAGPAIDGEIRHHLRARRRHINGVGAGNLEAAGGTWDAQEHSEARVLLADCWRTLSDRERRLLALRYYGDLSQAEIAEALEMSQPQVSRQLRTAHERLRSALGASLAAPSGAPYSGPEMATQAGQPEERPAHSGRILVRMPPSLHTELARAAEREGVSLNALVTAALAGSVGWRDDNEPPVAATGATPAPDRRGRLLSIALAANFAVVVLAAIVAIALLITAWAG